MGKRNRSEVSTGDARVEKSEVAAPVVPKAVKKVKKVKESEDDELYGTSSLKSNGLVWDKVSIGNLSFQDGSGLEGLVAVQVTDGTNFGKMFNGIRFQDKNMEKEYNDRLIQADKKDAKKKKNEDKKDDKKIGDSMIVNVAELSKKGKKSKSVVVVEEKQDKDEEDNRPEYLKRDDIDYEKLSERELAVLLGLSEEVEETAVEDELPSDFEGFEGDMMEGEGEGDFLLDDEDMDLEEMAELAGLDMFEGEEGDMEDEDMMMDDEDEEEMVFEDDEEQLNEEFIPDFMKKTAKPEVSKKEQLKKKEDVTKAKEVTVTKDTNTAATPAVTPTVTYSIKGLNSTEKFFNKYPGYDAWLPLQLHPYLMLGIAKAGFKQPMPIQNECFLPAYRDYRDVVGAAQTGSGKTLAFGLPILQHVLNERTRRNEDHKYALKLKGERNVYFDDELTGLIVTPTRELAVQIVDALTVVSEFCYINIVGVIGGVAEQKQERQLQKQPAIIIATPGRLWELMSKMIKPFDNLTLLRFFVLDEADRMVANGQFGELDNIIAFVQSFRDDLEKQKESEAIDERERRAEIKKYSSGKMIAVDEHGKEVFGDKKKLHASANKYVNMMKNDSIMEADEEEEEEEEDIEDEDDELEEDIIIEDTTGLFKPEDFLEDDDNEVDIGEEEEEEDEEDTSATSTTTNTVTIKNRNKKIQVFLFSATLTVDDDARGSRKEQKKRQKFVHRGQEVKGKSLLVTLSHKLPIEFPFIVDFSSQYLLAPGLSQELLECSTEDRDVFLYAKLYVNEGRSQIFVNSIDCARTLAVTLKELGMDAYALHAQMQQKQRLQVMDKFKSEKHPKAIIVCTDVAARGLDIPNVELVIQYHLAREPDTYIHRAGRTARAGTHGVCLNIVTPGEQLELKRLLHVLGPAGDMTKLRVNSKFIQHLRRRWKLAEEISKVRTAEHIEGIQNKWVKDQQDVLGLDMGLFDGEDGFSEKSTNKKMSNRDKREASKHNKWLNEQRQKRKRNDDDEDFSNAMFQAKRDRNELAAKRRDLDFYLSQKIYTKGTYFF